MMEVKIEGRRCIMGIGELLQTEREKLGLSLNDVENAIKIRSKYIQALEKENFDDIPGETYRLGFMRNYARLLGLDPEAVIAQYKSITKSIDRENDWIEARRVGASARRSTQGADQADLQQRDAVARRPAKDWSQFLGKIAKAASIFKNRNLLLGAAGVVVLALLVLAIVNVAHNTRLTAPSPPAQGQPGQPGVTAQVYSPPQTLEIRLVGKEDCWAEVKEDGTTVYEGHIMPGDIKTFTAQDSVWMELGYPVGVDVYYNGSELPPMDTTHPLTREFTKNMGAETD